jgi:threonine dehydrogenase-like Zn-dependent dehydrogenase
MWAYAIAGPGRFERVEAPTPEPPPGRVLARLRAGGICGSDVPSFHGTRNTFVDGYGEPGYPLHEVVGEVVAGDLPEGTRIVGWSEGHYGLAEYYVARVDASHELDDELTDIEATVVQPLCTVLAQLDRLPDVRGKRAAVIGLGSIGLLFAHVLHARGATVTGIDRVDRRDQADAFGLTTVIWEDAPKLPNDAFDVVVEAVGHQAATVETGVNALAEHGTLLAFGVPDQSHYAFPFRAFFRKHATLIAGAATDRASELAKARDYLREHRSLLEPYITDVFDVHDAQQAFELASAASSGRLKIVLTVPDGDPEAARQ